MDLRHEWPDTLRANGFDPAAPTAWLAEGLLPYLTSADQDLLFERIAMLSAADSRLAVEAFGPEFFDPQRLARRRENLRAVREAAIAQGLQVPETEALWYLEPRKDVGEWLQERGWEVSTIGSGDLMTRYHRPVPIEAGDAAPESMFIEATRN